MTRFVVALLLSVHMPQAVSMTPHDNTAVDPQALQPKRYKAHSERPHSIEDTW